MGLLLGQRCLLQLVTKDEFLSGVEPGHGFGPYLIDLCGRQIVVDDLRAALKAAVYGPVTTVAGGVAEEIGPVRGAEEHAPAGVLHRPAAISSPVAVLGLAQKLLGRLALAAAESRHFAQLDDPDAPQILAGFLAIEAGDAVVEPVTPHPAEQQALADALPAAQDADLVELAAGPEAPRHCRDEHLSRHRAGVAAVLRA